MIAAMTQVSAQVPTLSGHRNLHTRPQGEGPPAQDALMNRLFISQMLQFSGAFSTRGSFGGAAGEEQFASFLREEYAARLADRLQLLPALPTRQMPAE